MTHDPVTEPFPPQPRPRSRLGRFSRDWVDHPAMLLVPMVPAAVLFHPQGIYRVEDRPLAILRRIRGILAVVLVVGATVRFDVESIWSYPGNLANSASNTALISMFVVAAVASVVAIIVRPGQRTAALRALARPMFTIGLLIGCLVAAQWSGLVIISTEAPAPGAFGTGGPATLAGFFTGLLGNIAKLWLLAFFLSAGYFISRDTYAVADAHPKLTPLVTIGTTLALVVVDLLTSAGLRLPGLLPITDPRLPDSVSLWLAIAGIGSLLVLAVAEFVRLGSRSSSLREGPWL